MSTLIAASSCMLLGCNTTSGVGYGNPQYAGYRLNKTAVFVDVKGQVGDESEAELVKELRARGVDAKSVRNVSRFAASWEDFLAKVWNSGSHDILILSIESDSQSSDVAGYSMYGSAMNYGSTTNVSGTAVPVRVFSRSTSSVARVVLPTGEKAWESGVERSAGGLLFVGNSNTMHEIVEEIVETLEGDGLIARD